MPAVLEGTTPALEEVSPMVDDAKKRRLTRRKSWGGGRGSATPSKETEAGARGDAVSRAGLKKEPATFCKKHPTADGHHHQAVSEDRTGNEVTVRSHLRHDHHGHGARRGEEHERTDASPQRLESTSDLGLGHRIDRRSPEAGGSGGERLNAATLTGYSKQPDGMIMGTKCDHARFCRVDRTHQSEQVRITLAVDRSGVRDPVVSALQQLGAARKYGRAPPTQLSRELQQCLRHPTRQVGSDEGMLRAVSVWLGDERDHSSKPEVVVDGAERGSATCGDGFKGEHRAFPSRPLSPAFSVEQCSPDAGTRGGKFVSPSRIFSTLKGIPPPSCLVASQSFGDSVSSGQRTSGSFESQSCGSSFGQPTSGEFGIGEFG